MKIAVLGTGRMGSWLSGLLADGNQIAAYDASARAGRPEQVRILGKPADLAPFAPELLINCVTLSSTVQAFQEAVPFVPPGCVLCDIASIKTGLPDFYRQSGRRFASLHPMFGPTFASMAGLNGQNAIIISGSEPEATTFFTGFFTRLGVRLFEYSFEEHDRMMAYSLSVPFMASLVFAACVNERAVPGTTFAKQRSIAAGLLSEDDNLLAEVLFNPHTPAQIDRMSSHLEHLKHIIRQRDIEELVKVLRAIRDNLGTEAHPPTQSH